MRSPAIHPTTFRHDHDRGQRGQILVVFALAAVAIIASVGLVLDGGDTFAQRRTEQNVADLAALAGANTYFNASGNPTAKQTAALAAARTAATRNGYTHGQDGTTVTVVVNLVSSGATVTVDITRPHTNAFARIVGAMSWDVSVTAAAQAGTIDTGMGSAPWIMSINAFNANGTPKYTSPTAFGETNGDYPVSALDVAWTDYNGENNVNTTEVSQIISGANVVTSTFDVGQYLGQHNQGFHNSLFTDVNTYLAGKEVPVPITGPCPAGSAHTDGCFVGWAMFHVTSASGGSDKTITGYFLSDFVSLPLTIGECTPAQLAAGSCGLIPSSPFGGYVVRLTN